MGMQLCVLRCRGKRQAAEDTFVAAKGLGEADSDDDMLSWVSLAALRIAACPVRKPMLLACMCAGGEAAGSGCGT